MPRCRQMNALFILPMDAQKEGIEKIIDEYFYTTPVMCIYDDIISGIERVVIIKALEHSDGNQFAAAKMLGIHRNTLSSKIKKLKIDIWRFKK